MDLARKGQRWVLDALLAQGGLDVLHPGAGALFEQIGYNSVDIKRIFARIESGSQSPAAWATIAGEIERRADYWRGRGMKMAALDLYKRALVLYGRTHYGMRGERRDKYRVPLRRVLDQIIALTDSHRVERVELPFEGHTAHGIFQASHGAERQPCLIFLPGMDMFKEDWFSLIQRAVLPRGWTGLAFEGPGQGESLTSGLKLGLDNYERSVQAAIDWLSQRPEVDPEQIVLWGSSFGSYWGLRAAAIEPRIKGVACNMTNLGEKSILLQQAQPSFFSNLSYMSGIAEPEKLQAFCEAMSLDEIAPKVTTPFLVVAGESDELTTLEDTFGVYNRLKGPKELWVYEREFHPIGPTSAEWAPASIDWLQAVLEGQPPPTAGRQVFITQEGEYVEGTGCPLWWDPS